MDRRNFNKIGLMGLSASVIQGCSSTRLIDQRRPSNTFPIIKPKRLKKGDKIGLIAPASTFAQEAYESSVKHIQSLGFGVQNGQNLFKKYGNFAGTDAERVADIHAMFSDNSIDAIWCLRGGYGVTRILPMLDYKLIKRNPKLLIGYSDITALLHAIQIKTGLVGIHGPVAKSPLNDFTRNSIENIIFHPSSDYNISQATSLKEEDAYQSEVISPGNMKGILTGGNLSLLTALAGTPYHWDATNKLVFIEDIGEKPYRIDRMLTQLLQSSNLAKANGILLGIFADCEKKPDEKTLGLKEVIKDRLGHLGIPVYYGFTFGHIDNICSIPVGIEAHFDFTQKTLSLTESLYNH